MFIGLGAIFRPNRSRSDRPKTTQRSPQDRPKTAQDRPKIGQDRPGAALGRLLELQVDPSWPPRRLRRRYDVKNVIFQKLLKNAMKINTFEPQMPPKTTQDDPKTAPRPPRKRPRPAKTAPRPPQDRPRRPKTATTTPHDHARPPQDRPRAKKGLQHKPFRARTGSALHM